MQTAIKKFGRLDGLVLNAGQSGVGPVSSVAVAEWRKTMEVNVFSTLPAIQAALPALRETKEHEGLAPGRAQE